MDAQDFYLHFQTTVATFKPGCALDRTEMLEDPKFMVSVPERGNRPVEHRVAVRPYALLDAHWTRVGHVRLSSAVAERMGSRPLTFALISYAYHFDNSLGLRVPWATSRAVLPMVRDSIESWPIVNCTLISTGSRVGVYERIAIGRIPRLAWLDSSLAAQWMRLG